jgi:hypothetical protein
MTPEEITARILDALAKMLPERADRQRIAFVMFVSDVENGDNSCIHSFGPVNGIATSFEFVAAHKEAIEKTTGIQGGGNPYVEKKPRAS